MILVTPLFLHNNITFCVVSALHKGKSSNPTGLVTLLHCTVLRLSLLFWEGKKEFGRSVKMCQFMLNFILMLCKVITLCSDVMWSCDVIMWCDLIMWCDMNDTVEYIVILLSHCDLLGGWYITGLLYSWPLLSSVDHTEVCVCLSLCVAACVYLLYFLSSSIPPSLAGSNLDPKGPLLQQISTIIISKVSAHYTNVNTISNPSD